MSEENVELVRRGHEAFRDSGEEAIFEYLHADIDLTAVEELPGNETRGAGPAGRRVSMLPPSVARYCAGDVGGELDPPVFVESGSEAGLQIRTIETVTQAMTRTGVGDSLRRG
jgi:hypothetical protein